MSYQYQRLNFNSSLQSLLNKMKQAATYDQRKILASQLISMKDETSFTNDFIDNNGLDILSRWMKELKEKSEKSKNMMEEEEDILMNVVLFLDKANLTYEDLKKSKIGKYINKLRKMLSSNNKAKTACDNLVNDWREMIEMNTHNDKERNEDNYIGKKRRKNDNDESYDDSFKHNNDDYFPTKNNSKTNNIINNNHCNKPLKSCLKNSNIPSRKPKVRFETDIQKLEHVKIFKMTDTPNAPNISREEYLRIQQEIALNPHIFKIEDIRKKEIKLDHIVEAQIEWRFPIKMNIDVKGPCGESSLEREVIEEICSKVLSVNYFDKIPEPKEGECKLFSFEDEEIPKIENMKQSTKSTNNNLTKEDFFLYINSLQDDDINPELIKKIESTLEKYDCISAEKRNEVMAQLTSRITQNNRIVPPQPIPYEKPPIMQQEMLQKIPFQIGLPFNTLGQPNVPPGIPFGQNMNPNIPPGLNPIPNLPPGINPNLPPGMNPNLPPNMNPNVPPFMFPGMVPQFNKIMEPQRVENIPNIPPPISSKINMQKYRTKPCRNYHSSLGCKRGEYCIFIHDPAFAGVDIPNFNPNNYEKTPYPGAVPQNQQSN